MGEDTGHRGERCQKHSLHSKDAGVEKQLLEVIREDLTEDMRVNLISKGASLPGNEGRGGSQAQKNLVD